MPVTFSEFRFCSVAATPQTSWYFLTVKDIDGFETVVEFTKGKQSLEVARGIQDIFDRIVSRSVRGENCLTGLLGIKKCIDGRTTLAAAVSAVRTAISQLESLQNSETLAKNLKGQFSESVPIYGNINRGLFNTGREPSDFVRAAEAAVNQGFDMIKCAPFDEVHSNDSRETILENARPGIDRIKAIRKAMGEKLVILIDCHARFEEHSAYLVSEELHRLNIGWFEEPLDPNDEPEKLSKVLKKVSMPVAGGESVYGELSFSSLLKNGSLNVIMPDIKYCGGVAEAVKSARKALEIGGAYSLHSPSGPISLAASAHVTAAAGGALPLEHAIDEVDWRCELVCPFERIEAGKIILEDSPGIGCTLNDDVLKYRGEQFNV